MKMLDFEGLEGFPNHQIQVITKRVQAQKMACEVQTLLRRSFGIHFGLKIAREWV